MPQPSKPKTTLRLIEGLVQTKEAKPFPNSAADSLKASQGDLEKQERHLKKEE